MTLAVTVVGAGIVGLSVARAAAEAGADVRCLDPAGPMSRRSAGGSRILRVAHGDPALVERAARARSVWDRWSRRAGRELVGAEGAVVSGARVPQWADAMAAAGAAHEVVDAVGPGILPGPTDGPVLHDPAGGVIDMRAAGAFLAGTAAPERITVHAVDPDATVHTDAGPVRADAVVVAAGARTPALLAELGVTVPDGSEHHTRFAFRLREPSFRPACHLDGVPRGPLASTYQHRTRDGLWAVGGHLPDADTAWELGADEVARRSRDAVVAHVTEHLPGVDPDPVEELRCEPARGLGDGVHTARVGAVHAVWGDNLAKLAPDIGTEMVAVLAR